MRKRNKKRLYTRQRGDAPDEASPLIFCKPLTINRILLTLRNCLNGALTLTSTASDTIVTNYICHNRYFL